MCLDLDSQSPELWKKSIFVVLTTKSLVFCYGSPSPSWLKLCMCIYLDNLSPVLCAFAWLLLLATSMSRSALGGGWVPCSRLHVSNKPFPAWTAADAATSSHRRLSSNWSHLSLCLLTAWGHIKGKRGKRKIDEEEHCVLCSGQSMDTKGVLAALFSEVSTFSLLRREKGRRNPSSLSASRGMK